MRLTADRNLGVWHKARKYQAALGTVLGLSLLAATAPLRADDPYGVVRGTPGVVRLKVTNDREIRQNQLGGANYPEETFRVLAYNLFMLPTLGCAVGVDPCRAGTDAKWQLIDDAIAEVDPLDGGYDVLVLPELWEYGVSALGLDGDPAYSLSGLFGYGYWRLKDYNNGFGTVQSQLWERGFLWQTKAPGAWAQRHEDGGVFIASKHPIVAWDEFVFTDCDGTVWTHIFGGGTSDCSARKGVVWAKIQKNPSRAYHVFATHMQASAFNSDGSRHADWPTYVSVRASQLAEFANFVASKTNDGSIGPNDMVILAGDFNIISGDGEHADMLTTLGATEPPLITLTGRPFTANDQVTNDLAPVLGGAEGPSRIDYVLFSNLHRRPVNPRQVIRPVRTASPWTNGANGGSQHHDLSDHHAVLGGFTWSHLSDSGHPRVALATGDRTAFLASQWTASTSFRRSSYMKVLAGDFNGDGKTDVVHVETPEPGAASASKPVRAAISDGVGGFSAGVWANWSANDSFRYLTGDFNGDLKTDLLRVETPATGTGARNFIVSLSNGSSAFGSSSWGASGVGPDDLLLTGDFTGDGRSDVLQVQVPPPGSGFAPRNLILARNFSRVGSNSFGDWNAAGAGWMTSATDMEVLVGDFNGDGKTDVLKIDLPYSGCARLGFWVGTTYQESGTGLFKFAVEGDHPHGEWTRPLNCRNSKYFTGDFDADGRTDVGWVRFDSGDPEAVAPRQVFTALARPSGVRGKWFFYVIPAPYTVPASIYTKFLAADFDGDNTTDLLRLTVPDRGRYRSCMALRISYARGERTGTFEEETGNILNELGNNGCESDSGYFWPSYKQLKMLTGDFNFDGKTDVLFFDVPTI